MRDGRYAIVGDIHGNREALNAILDDARQCGVDEYVCVGDLVGYNADPSDCLERIKELCCAVVRGNHDHYCSHDESLDDFHPLAASVVDWTRQQLSARQTEYLHDLPLTQSVAGFAVVHSTLDMPERWGYVFDSLEAESHFNYQTNNVCFYGHTHIPVVFEKENGVQRLELQRVKITLGKKYFINVGSVGQPRDGDPRSSYAIYDLKKREVEFRRVAYDLEKTQEKIRKAGLPERLARRLEVGK